MENTQFVNKDPVIGDNSDFAKVMKSVSAPLEESQRAYETWTPNYEEDLRKQGYRGPELTVQYTSDVIPESARATVRVLDIGAGTGMVAKGLLEEGFSNIDALEPNATMLDVARKRDLYKNYYIEYITADPCSLAEGSYDVLTGSGIFAPGGHVPHDAVLEMIRLVKSGGYIVLVTRPSLLFEGGPYEKLEPLMRHLESEGRWRCVHRDIVPKYYFNLDGIVWVYQKL